jgi:hypothetical protein
MLPTTSAHQLETHYTPEPRSRMRLLGTPLPYSGLPESNPLRAEHEDARRTLDEITLGPAAAIIALIQPLVEKVEADESIEQEIFRFSRVVTQHWPGQIRRPHRDRHRGPACARARGYQDRPTPAGRG